MAKAPKNGDTLEISGGPNKGTYKIIATKTSGRKIALGKGFRLDKKTGKPVKSTKHMDASRRLQQAASKKIRINRGTK